MLITHIKNSTDGQEEFLENTYQVLTHRFGSVIL